MEDASRRVCGNEGNELVKKGGFCDLMDVSVFRRPANRETSPQKMILTLEEG